MCVENSGDLFIMQAEQISTSQLWRGASLNLYSNTQISTCLFTFLFQVQTLKVSPVLHMHSVDIIWSSELLVILLLDIRLVLF